MTQQVASHSSSSSSQQQAKMPTAAHRAGGKFANRSAITVAAAVASNDANNNKSLWKQQRQHRQQTQDRLYADLERAESIVLDMLSLASSSAAALSKLATGSDEEKGEDTTTSVHTLYETVQLNGVRYLDDIKRVHDLLLPYSELVVSYRNHEVDTLITPTNGEAAADPTPKTSKVEHPQHDEVNRITRTVNNNNMYMSRVEMRLAIERREIMKEFLRLETNSRMIDNNDHDNEEECNKPRDDDVKKRKRDEE